MHKKINFGIIISVLVILTIVTIMLISLINKPTYKVIFNSNNGTEDKIVEVKAKEKVTKISDPVKEGNIFLGWYLENEKYDFDTIITKSITLIAKYEEVNKKTVTLKFDSLEGSIIEDIEIEIGNILNNIPNPTKENYIFKGWYYNNKEFDFTKPISKDMVFVAKWKKDNSKKYTVTFDTDKGSNIASVKVSENSLVKEPDIPFKDGYRFKGWYLDDKEYDFTTKITKDITLKAKWEKNN